MDNYARFHGLIIGVAVLAISGCTVTSHYGPDPPEWDYKCPEFVSDEDNKYCHDYAYEKASHVFQETATDSFTNTATLLGPFGVFGGFAYISEKEDWVYEDAFKECLRERGYDIK